MSLPSKIVQILDDVGAIGLNYKLKSALDNEVEVDHEFGHHESGKRSVAFHQNVVDDNECDQKPDFRMLMNK
jgi:hypothetical protein